MHVSEQVAWCVLHGIQAGAVCCHQAFCRQQLKCSRKSCDRCSFVPAFAMVMHNHDRMD